jgi:hypothetical protein
MAGALGEIGLDRIERLTLRELLWTYDGSQYSSWMFTGSIVAGLYNVQRVKTSDRIWTFKDFHPAHGRDEKPRGKQHVANTLSWFGDNVTWLEGYGPEMLHGKQ